MLTHRHSSAQKPSPPLNATQRLAKAKALDREIKGLHRRRNKDRVLLVARLAALKASRGYLSLDFPSVQAYAASRLGWGAGKVKALLSLHTRLPQRPLLREAFEAGELDWTKAVLACRGAEQEPEREAEWLKATDKLSSRQLEAKVAEVRGVPQEERRSPWTFEFNALDRATIQAGLTALHSEGLGLDSGAALAELVRRALHGGSAGSSRVRFLLDQCTDCGKTSHPTADGDVSVSAAVAARLRCDSETHDVRVKPARVSSTIPPSVRNAVLARSKGICEFPGCGLNAWLEVHHGRGRGRGHEIDWLFHFCAGHHKAPHEGAVRIEGSWGTGVRFLRADGELIGTVGGPEKEAHVTPVQRSPSSQAAAGPSSQAAAADSQNPAAGESREPGAVDSASPSAPTERGSPPEERFALLALKSLEFPAREAKSLLRVALAEQPGALAGELVRAVLLRYQGSRSA